MGICKHYGEEFDCCKLLSDFRNPMTDLRPCTKDEHECKYYKPLTNFDRITESVESLANFIRSRVTCTVCPIINCPLYNTKNCKNDECLQSIKEWLQKECEG